MKLGRLVAQFTKGMLIAAIGLWVLGLPSDEWKFWAWFVGMNVILAIEGILASVADR